MQVDLEQPIHTMLASCRVLFVEDDAPTRRLMSAFARMLGAATVEAESAEQALTYMTDHVLDDEAPGLLVVDVSLPGMDGITLCRTLAERSLFPTDRVIVVSGTESTDDLRRIGQLRVRRFLHKPFPLEDLREALCRSGSEQEDTESTEAC